MTLTPTEPRIDGKKRICVLWTVLGCGLVAAATLLLAHRHRFDWAFELIQIPAVPFAVGLCLAGLLVMPLPWLIGLSAALDRRLQRRLLAAVIVTGLALRGMMFAVEPVLEDDYYRYLWDGAVSAHGLNPYALPPSEAALQPDDSLVSDLARDADVVLDRVNHPDLKTIYPPVAQAAFALAHWLRPWSIAAWRAVCLGGELTTLGLLLALLNAVGRSPLWIALYWWNPLIIKEMINSAHMEAILLPLMLAALLLAVKRWPFGSLLMLGLAMGAKLWPVMLAPLLLRPLLLRPAQLIAGLGVLAIMAVLWAAPPWIGGIDETSGFVAYAANWKTNSALFPALESVTTSLLNIAGLDPSAAGRVARGVCAMAVVAVALWMARTPWTQPVDLVNRAGTVVITLFLLTPAQFPWYAAWMLPFLCFRPSLALLGVSVLLPLYYASFYFHARDTYDIFRDRIVWLIWLPIWVGLTLEALRGWRRAARNPDQDA